MMKINESPIFFSILYSPEQNAIDNIISALKYGFIPVVYLNCVDEIFESKLRDLGVLVLGENKNVGLGTAFYELESYLSLKECKHYLYFDQDTVVKDCAWKVIKEDYNEAFSKSGVGMLFYTSNINSRFNNGLVVSSGCLFSLKVMDNTGFHSKELFVEGVDYDYCMKLLVNDLKINVRVIPGIDHESLQDDDYITFFGFKFKVRTYGQSRQKDFNRSHFALIKTALSQRLGSQFMFFLKSFVKFNVNECFVRLIIKK